MSFKTTREFVKPVSSTLQLPLPLPPIPQGIHPQSRTQRIISSAAILENEGLAPGSSGGGGGS